MPRSWKYAIQESVGANRYVPLPAEVADAVTVDHPLDGPSIHWSYEEHSNYVVLSETHLSEPNYVDVGRYKVYDASDPNRQVRIRPPDRLGPIVRSNFDPESRVVFLAHEEMVDGDNASVYLLSTAQLLDLLPEDVEGSAPAPDITEALLRTPGILPPP